MQTKLKRLNDHKQIGACHLVSIGLSRDEDLLMLLFADDTYIVFYPKDWRDQAPTIEVYTEILTDDELIQFGLVSRAEFDLYQAERAKAKEQFEELKKKWGF